MGLRGPRPKPTKLKLLEGTHRPDRVAANEPTPDAALLACPKGLPPVARAEWNRVAPELHRLGLSAKIDRAALLGYVLSYARAMAAEKQLQEEGNTLTTSTGYLQAHPCVSIARNEWAAVRNFAGMFGFSPASRTRISTPQKSPADTTKARLFSSKPA